jgi:hypothetical protein
MVMLFAAFENIELAHHRAHELTGSKTLAEVGYSAFHF